MRSSHQERHRDRRTRRFAGTGKGSRGRPHYPANLANLANLANRRDDHRRAAAGHHCGERSSRPAPLPFEGDAPRADGRIPRYTGKLRAHANPPDGAGTVAHRTRAFQSRCGRLRRSRLSHHDSRRSAAVRRILEPSRSVRAHRSGDRDAVGRHVRADRGRSRRHAPREVPGERSAAGSGPLPPFRSGALAREQERAAVRARRGVPRGRAPAGIRDGRRGRLPDAHHRGVRQWQVRDRRLRSGARGQRILPCRSRPRCSPSISRAC